MAFLKDRYCAKCGSTMVTWRFKEPHCFCCGSNLPFSSPDFVPPEPPTTNRILLNEEVLDLSYEECLQKEGMTSIISFDPILDLAHKIFTDLKRTRLGQAKPSKRKKANK